MAADALTKYSGLFVRNPRIDEKQEICGEQASKSTPSISVIANATLREFLASFNKGRKADTTTSTTQYNASFVKSDFFIALTNVSADQNVREIGRIKFFNENGNPKKISAIQQGLSQLAAAYEEKLKAEEQSNAPTELPLSSPSSSPSRLESEDHPKDLSLALSTAPLDLLSNTAAPGETETSSTNRFQDGHAPFEQPGSGPENLDEHRVSDDEFQTRTTSKPRSNASPPVTDDEEDLTDGDGAEGANKPRASGETNPKTTLQPDDSASTSSEEEDHTPKPAISSRNGSSSGSNHSSDGEANLTPPTSPTRQPLQRRHSDPEVTSLTQKAAVHNGPRTRDEAGRSSSDESSRSSGDETSRASRTRNPASRVGASPSSSSTSPVKAPSKTTTYAFRFLSAVALVGGLGLAARAAYINRAAIQAWSPWLQSSPAA